MFETNDQNGWVVEALADFAPVPFGYSLAFEVYQRMPNDTDFSPFRDAGVQGMNFAGIDNAHVYHQENDTPDNLDPAEILLAVDFAEKLIATILERRLG